MRMVMQRRLDEVVQTTRLFSSDVNSSTANKTTIVIYNL